LVVFVFLHIQFEANSQSKGESKMTTQVNEKYVLSEEETNLRKAMSFLKGCVVGYATRKGQKHKSTKTPTEDFLAGFAYSGPQKVVKYGHEYTIYRNDDWITVAHIVHNRTRHDRPHTESNSSDNAIIRSRANTVKEIVEEVESRYNIDLDSLL
jgi:hypothetical protein